MSGLADIGVAVTHLPSRAEYLGDTLDSYWLAGFPESPVIIRDERPRLGPKPTFKRALWALRDHQWALVIQDDVLLAKGLRFWLRQIRLADAVHSLYCSAAHDGPDGWREVDLTPTAEQPLPWHNGLGACALLLPSRVAAAYLEHDPQLERTDRIGASVGEFCHRQGVPFLVHSPSLVQHVGERSCLHGFGITDCRRAARFWDDIPLLGDSAELETAVSHSPDRGTLADVPAGR